MRDVNMSPIRSIDRAVDILQAFSIQQPSLTIEQISNKAKIPKSTVYRILCTLEGRGLVQFDEKTLRYTPGLRLMEFGFLVSSVLDVRTEAEDILIDLQAKTNQTILMAVKEGDELLYIYKKEKDEGLKFSSYVGQRRPFIYGVLGPALLAFLPDKEKERILNIPIAQHTPYTITDKGVIRQRLQQIEKDGFYIESNETNIGVTGIGAPILGLNGEGIAAIGVIGPAVELDDQLEKVKPLLLEASYNISLKMGYQKAD
jgi:IclR family KDG regulon transcriptional repressor